MKRLYLIDVQLDSERGIYLPFTFAHPAVILPFRRINKRYLSTTGLILGSMAPDFEYFIMLEPYQSIGHTFLGLFLQAIPLCVLFAFIWYQLVMKELALHLPISIEKKRRHGLTTTTAIHPRWQLSQMRDWMVYITSVVLGFYSHIFLDAFTHQTGFFVQRWTWLNDSLIFNIPIYKFMQHGFTLIGLMVIGWWFLRTYSLRRKENQIRKQQVWFWLVVGIVMITTVLFKLLISGRITVGMLVVSPISGFVLGIVSASFIAVLKRKWSRLFSS